jgi:hypothetical protein
MIDGLILLWAGLAGLFRSRARLEASSLVSGSFVVASNPLSQGVLPSLTLAIANHVSAKSLRLLARRLRERTSSPTGFTAHPSRGRAIATLGKGVDQVCGRIEPDGHTVDRRPGDLTIVMAVKQAS